MFTGITEEKIVQMLRDYSLRLSASAVNKPATPDVQNGNRCLPVLVTSAASGGGKYNGRVLIQNSGDVSASGNTAATEWGADPGADNALVLNNQEIGLSTHDLMSSSNTVFVFPGVLLRINSDGTLVMGINGFFYGC